MTNDLSQLTLIDTPPEWRLDERTRQVGRRGLAEARAALQAGRRGLSSGPPGERDGSARHPGSARPARRPAA